MSTQPLTIAIVTPEDHWLNRILTWFYVRWMKRRVSALRLDPNAPCPACGHRNGGIAFIPTLAFGDGSHGGIVHHCKICDANWPEKPIIKADGPAGWVIDMPTRDGDL